MESVTSPSIPNPDQRTGGFFFTPPFVNLPISDETRGPPNVYVQDRFKTIPTVWAICTSIVLQVILMLVVYLVPEYCDHAHCHIPAKSDYSSLVVYAHVVFWLFIFLIYRYLCRQHNILRTNGYSIFSQQTACHRQFQLFVYSIGNICLLVMVTLMDDYDYCKHAESDCLFLPHSQYRLTQTRWLQILLCLEFIITAPVLIIYLVSTIRFNCRRSTPDIFNESSLTPDVMSQRTVIGFRDTSLLEETLERQADHIQCLNQRCEQLSRHILQLTLEYENYSQNDINNHSGNDVGRGNNDGREARDTDLLLTD